MSAPTRLRRRRPLGLRLWHWLNAAALLGALGTVLLRKTVFSWRTNSALIEAQVREAGGSISTAAAVELAKALREPMWQWHYVFGFALAALLALRFALPLVVRDPELSPLRSVWRDVARWLPLPPAQKRTEAHHLLVRLLYAAFYLALTFMAASGLALYFKGPLGLSKELAGSTKEAHELTMWFFVVFTVGHLVGVVVAELRGERGLVSDMIHGGDPAAP
jgi:cytochrome b561